MNHISYIIFWSISITITHSNRSTNLPFETPSWLHVAWRHSTPRPLKPRLPTPASTAVHPLGSTFPNPAQLPGQRGSLEEKKMNTGKKRWLTHHFGTINFGDHGFYSSNYILQSSSHWRIKNFWAIAIWFMTNAWKDWLMTHGELITRKWHWWICHDITWTDDW